MKLKAIEKLCSEATPGPWYHYKSERCIKQLENMRNYEHRKQFNIAKYPMRTDKYPISHEEYEANAEFIAASRELIPKLLAVAKDARHVIDHIAKSHKEMTINSLYDYLTKIANSLKELEKE